MLIFSLYMYAHIHAHNELHLIYRFIIMNKAEHFFTFQMHLYFQFVYVVCIFCLLFNNVGHLHCFQKVLVNYIYYSLSHCENQKLIFPIPFYLYTLQSWLFVKMLLHTHKYHHFPSFLLNQATDSVNTTTLGVEFIGKIRVYFLLVLVNLVFFFLIILCV